MIHFLFRLGLVLKPRAEDDQESVDETKILFCSRTHSQLTQFVQEVRKVNLPPPSWAVRTEVLNEGEDKQVLIKHLPLGSRRNLCINQKVAKLRHAPAITERCLELQQPDTPKDHKCPYLPSPDSETLVNEFRDHTLATIRDIEDLGNLGRKIGICPYYASRSSIKPSEVSLPPNSEAFNDPEIKKVLTLPYPLLLQKSAREALDLSLKGHVIIIDEAHNLMDTISNIHSISVSHAQLKRCREIIGIYLHKFRNRLKGKNRVYVAQLVRLVDSILAFLDSKVACKPGSDGLVSISTLMAGKGVDQINLYKLMQYLLQSKLARKVENYVEQEEQRDSKEERRHGAKPRSTFMPVLTHVQSFLASLTNPAAEGRFFHEMADDGQLSLKYMLLDPTYHFKEIVEDARAVILAGGTMSPMDDYARHILAYVSPDRLMTWSCGHIIPKDNLIAIPVATSPDGIVFDFTYEKRSSSLIMTALGGCLARLAACVPDGMVVFFPSYGYLDQVVAHWKRTHHPKATSPELWDQLSALKPIFQESKTASVEDTLTSYSLSISTGKGGLLLSVINGKLSEGINFSDGLGRAVAVVGLPFPNIHSAEWRAKLEFIEQSTSKRAGRNMKEGKEASREFYENACMRAVNQSIGRAIRHKGDYAGILLLDRRYAGGSGRIAEKLPGWIRQGMVSQETGECFEGVTRRLGAFFDEKKGSET